jgi:hypothetical protein
VLSVPTLIGDFGVLLGSYLNDEPLERGAHWAVAAIAKSRPDLFADKIDVLTTSLKSADPYVRGFALMALGSLDEKLATEQAQMLVDDVGKLSLYSRATGEMHSITVGEVAKDVVTGRAGVESSIDVW